MSKDIISRQMAINEAKELYDMGDCYCDRASMIGMLNSLPPAQPEQRWILCSERLPEDNQFVLMTIRRMNEHYNHKPFISVGYIAWNQSLWWCAHDGNCEQNDIRVDAWMPLPEPYQEGANE